MKFRSLFIIFISLLVFLGSNALAQLDPASGLLLNSDAKSSNRENGLDSGRYTVRPHSDSNGSDRKKAPKVIEKKVDPADEDDDQSGDAVQASTPSAPPSKSSTNDNSNPNLPNQNTKAQNFNAERADPSSDAVVNLPPTPPVQKYLPASPVDEKKNNIVEISIAPTFIHNHSSSEFSFRNYSTTNLAYFLDVTACLQKNFALHGQITNSLAASVNDSYDHTRSSNLIQQWISGGFRYRNFVSNQRNASSLIFGLDYEDYQFQIDTDARIRNRIATTGFKLSIFSEIPNSSRYSWELGGEFIPKAKHQENLTSASIQSGDSPEAYVIAISVGGRIYVDSSNQVYWRLTERLEKDQYLGSTSKVDPATNQTFSNVGVLNSFTMLQFGYTWGN